MYSNKIPVRRRWTVVEIPWFTVEDQLVGRSQTLLEEDGGIGQILDPKTVAWSLGSHVLSCCTKVSSLKVETKP